METSTIVSFSEQEKTQVLGILKEDYGIQTTTIEGRGVVTIANNLYSATRQSLQPYLESPIASIQKKYIKLIAQKAVAIANSFQTKIGDPPPGQTLEEMQEEQSSSIKNSVVQTFRDHNRLQTVGVFDAPTPNADRYPELASQKNFLNVLTKLDEAVQGALEDGVKTKPWFEGLERIQAEFHNNVYEANNNLKVDKEFAVGEFQRDNLILLNNKLELAQESIPPKWRVKFDDLQAEATKHLQTIGALRQTPQVGNKYDPSTQHALFAGSKGERITKVIRSAYITADGKMIQDAQVSTD